MKILKLILYRYKRFSLNNIERLEYTPESNIQVILGRNMCGKSSLLKELSPLPAEVKKEFRDGGYKEIYIEHNRSAYILKSSITGSKAMHNFIVDNKELNNGGTKKVQLELVKQHFSITPEIMEILLNKNRFTTMSPMDRKKWFSEMSSIDYTYPISIYSKIKTKHRDMVGGIKLIQDNIVNTESKLKNTELLDKYNNDKTMLEALRDHLASLHVISNPVQYTIEDILSNLDSSVNNLKYIAAQLNTKRSKQDISKTITEDRVKLDNTIKNIELVHKELDLIDKSREYGAEEELKRELKSNKDKLDTIVEDIKVNIGSSININNIYNDYEIYKTISNDLIGNANAISEYDKYKDITKDKQLELTKMSLEVNNTLVILSKRLLTIQEELKQIESKKTDDNKVVCDNCGNTWYNKYDINKITKLKELLEVTTKEIETKTKQQEEVTKLLSKIESREELLNNIKNIMRSNTNLNYVWANMLSSIDINTSSSEVLITYFNKYMVLLHKWSECTKLNNNIESIEKKIKFIEDTKKLNISIEQERYDNLNKRLHDLNNLRNNLESSVKNNEKELRLLDRLEEYYSKVHSMLFNIKSTYDKIVVDERNKHLAELLNTVKLDIIELDKEIYNFKNAKDNLEKDKSTLSGYKVKEKVLGILEKELSPSEGLIAKSMNSFLNVFVEEMNSVISNVWSYGLELLPCSIDSENGLDLDYKFKVSIDGNEVIEDVSKLSSSGQEIVDLAYRIVFAKYIGLEDIPLYLDEYGHSFDPIHRSKAYESIDKIISSDYGQIFIICHYESLYSSLRNVDFNILDPNNIETNYIKDNDSKLIIN